MAKGFGLEQQLDVDVTHLYISNENPRPYVENNELTSWQSKVKINFQNSTERLVSFTGSRLKEISTGMKSSTGTQAIAGDADADLAIPRFFGGLSPFEGAK